MKQILSEYVHKFNNNDNEYYIQDIDNKHALNWMAENVPLIEIPDKTIEEIYYFRWWVFRKHIKTTPDGTVLTEFLPPVPWGGRYNTIIAAAHHHIAEAKWLKNSENIIEDYVKLWLFEKSKTYLYSSPIIYAIYEYSVFNNNFSFALENLSLMAAYYEKAEKEHITKSSLMWSIDEFDAMEKSISGSDEEGTPSKGVRPTLNSYMAANAFAISHFAKIAGDSALAQKFEEKYNTLKEKINTLLWDGSFYKAIHQNIDNPSFKNVPQSRNVKELIGYIPWCYALPPQGREAAFSQLFDESGFMSPYGLTTAEKRHSRYLYKNEHECLWNGYIWPFATSQVLNAMGVLLEKYEQNTINKDHFYKILKDYANMHYLVENNKKVCFIDEVMSPETGTWSSREILKRWGWLQDKGGFERGKDYNHSTFCSIVLSYLLGIKNENGKIYVNPNIPDNWEHFKVENLYCGGVKYNIAYNKNTGVTIKKGGTV